MDHAGRLRRLQEQLRGFDAILVSHLPNIRYLCGFTGSSGVLLVFPKKAVFFTDGRYTEQAREEVKAARIVVSRKPAILAAAEFLAKQKLGRNARVGVEAEYLSLANRGRITFALGKTFRLKEAPPLVEMARMVKDEEEIERITAAVLMGASLFDTTLKTVRPGIKENEVAAEMEYVARRAGAEQMSFETIIASGKRSALPHGRASEATVPRQGFVVCDFGVILAGYCSDMTRTVYVGRPSGEARDFYEAVRAAQLAAIAAVRPGVAVGEVDQAARKFLKRIGLGRFFSHSTGHGVGLEIHERPRVAAGQTEILQAGMVITIEPGAYIPGKWGVRIEDMVLVTETGCEVLTPTSKELVAV
jgi:Xaa-Pro aminopeptidase